MAKLFRWRGQVGLCFAIDHQTVSKSSENASLSLSTETDLYSVQRCPQMEQNASEKDQFLAILKL